MILATSENRKKSQLVFQRWRLVIAIATGQFLRLVLKNSKASYEVFLYIDISM